MSDVIVRFPPEWERGRARPPDVDLFGHFSALARHPVSFASSGKAAIRAILGSFGFLAGSRVVIPAYACESIPFAVRAAGLEPVLCDIDEADLNVSVASLEVAIGPGAVAAIVPSLYGHPAALLECEEMCRRHRIVMIDDAAQAYGAALDARPVGSFGHAGFWSFGPGKPLASAGGAAFWTSGPDELTLRPPGLVAQRLLYADFVFNRVDLESTQRVPLVGRVLGRLSRAVNSDERRVVQGAGPLDLRHATRVVAAFERLEAARRALFARAAETLPPSVRLVRAVRGEAAPFKVVLVFEDSESRARAVAHFHRRRVAVDDGYRVLEAGGVARPVAADLAPRVLEVPLATRHADYLLATLAGLAEAL